MKYEASSSLKYSTDLVMGLRIKLYKRILNDLIIIGSHIYLNLLWHRNEERSPKEQIYIKNEVGATPMSYTLC